MTTWRQLLTTYLAHCMAEFGHTPYWDLNSRVTQLAGAYDPAVLPLLGRYVRHPQLDVRATGPRQRTRSGASSDDAFPWPPAPTVVTLLRGIADRANKESTRLLHICLTSHDPDIRLYGALALTGVSRKTAISVLTLEATTKEASDTAIEVLLKLGGSREIGMLIENLARNQEPAQEWRRKRDYELLLRYTQENIGYDPQGSPTQQDEGVRAWHKWWKHQFQTSNPDVKRPRSTNGSASAQRAPTLPSHVDRRSSDGHRFM